MSEAPSALSFEPGNPAAAALVNRLQDRFVEIFGDPVGRRIIPVLTAALLSGEGPGKAAVPLREIVGSSYSQKVAVEIYRRHLESGSLRGLRHPLRDRRADVAVKKAVAGTPIKAERIERLCTEMDRRMTTVRAEAIMCEAMSICTAVARHEALLENCRRAGIEISRVMKTWRSVIDGRETSIERELNGREIPYEQSFITAGGLLIRFPGDPDAPRSTRTGVRSTVTHRIILDP